MYNNIMVLSLSFKCRSGSTIYYSDFYVINTRWYRTKRLKFRIWAVPTIHETLFFRANRRSPPVWRLMIMWRHKKSKKTRTKTIIIILVNTLYVRVRNGSHSCRWHQRRAVTRTIENDWKINGVRVYWNRTDRTVRKWTRVRNGFQKRLFFCSIVRRKSNSTLNVASAVS